MLFSFGKMSFRMLPPLDTTSLSLSTSRVGKQTQGEAVGTVIDDSVLNVAMLLQPVVGQPSDASANTTGKHGSRPISAAKIITMGPGLRNLRAEKSMRFAIIPLGVEGASGDPSSPGPFQPPPEPGAGRGGATPSVASGGAPPAPGGGAWVPPVAVRLGEVSPSGFQLAARG